MMIYIGGFLRLGYYGRFYTLQSHDGTCDLSHKHEARFDPLSMNRS